MPFKTIKIANFETFAGAFGRFYFDESFFIDPVTESVLVGDADIDMLVKIGRAALGSSSKGPFIITQYCYSEMCRCGLKRYFDRFLGEGLLFHGSTLPSGRIHENVPKIIEAWPGKILCLTNEEDDIHQAYAGIAAKPERMRRRANVSFAGKHADGHYYRTVEETASSAPRSSVSGGPIAYKGSPDGKPIAVSDAEVLKPLGDYPSKTPETGASLDTLHHGKITLGPRLGSGDAEGKGGAGTIFQVKGHPDWIAKIIHEGTQRTKGNEEKLKFALAHDPHDPRLGWPIDILYGGGHYIGIIYPLIKGKDLSSFVGMDPEAELPPLPDLLEILAKVCDIFDTLHSMHIVVGDVRLSNFMVGKDARGKFDPKKVYAIDIDSLQIDKYPCLQYTLCYAPPSMHPFVLPDPSKAKATFRTYETDDYSLAVLLFLFLCFFERPGEKSHDPEIFISTRAGSDEAPSARQKGDFPYTLDQTKTQSNLGEGKKFNGYVWSHFPKPVKEAFVKVFTLKGTLSPSEWAKLLRSWARLASSRKLKANDPDCDILYFGWSEIPYSKVDLTLASEETSEGVGLDLASAIKAGAAKLGYDPSAYLAEAVRSLRTSPKFDKGEFGVEILADYGFAKKVAVSVEK